MSDDIDYAQARTEQLTQDALDRTVRHAHEAHDQLIIWADHSGGMHEHRLHGTCQDRLDYMDAHLIGDLPFAFAYTNGTRRLVGGNDKQLRRLIEQRD